MGSGLSQTLAAAYSCGAVAEFHRASRSSLQRIVNPTSPLLLKLDPLLSTNAALKRMYFPAPCVLYVGYKRIGHARAGQEVQVNVACKDIPDAPALGLLATRHEIPRSVDVFHRSCIDDP